MTASRIASLLPRRTIIDLLLTRVCLAGVDRRL
jgi:hypothetical protein